MTEVQGDFETQNQINHWRNRLDDIRDWYPQLSDTMTTISGYSMDLTGVRGTTERIPGGDALAMLAPWAPDAEYGDDLCHPGQIVREWTERLAGQAFRSWAQNWRWLHDHVPEILQSPASDAWRADIDALWHRLAALTNNQPEREPDPEITTEMVVEALRQNPEHRITRKDISNIFDIPASTITTWRSRGLETDHRGTYRAGDILERLAG